MSHSTRPLRSSSGHLEIDTKDLPRRLSATSLKHTNSSGNLRHSGSSGSIEYRPASPTVAKQKSMIDAASRGDIDTIRELVHTGKNVNRRGTRNTTPLHVAAFHDHFECVKYVLQKGANVNAVDDDGSTALQNAAYNGSTESVKILIKGGATLDSHDNDGSTPLHKAAFAGRLDALKYLVRKGANVNVVDDSKATPLHHAAANGFVEIVDYLLRKGAKPNRNAEDGTTPLHRTIAAGNVETVSVLLCNGADPNVVEAGQATPLHYAAEYGFVDIAELLINNQANMDLLDQSGATPLHIAAYNGYTKLVRLLCEKGAKTIVDGATFSALHHAAFSGQRDCVQVLLDHKVDPNVRDEDDATPLHKAAFSGHLDTLQALVTSGAKVNVQDSEGSTPLHKAAFSGRDRCVKFLLQSGALATTADKDNGTPLHNAVFNGHLFAVQILVEEGKSNVNAQDYEGTPLHVAITQNHRNVAEFLISKGSDLHVVGASGLTPVHAAAAHSPECLTLLGESGANLNIVDSKGWTPLHYAVAAGKEEAVEYLILKGADVSESVSTLAERTKAKASIAAEISNDMLQEMIKKREKLRAEHNDKEYSIAVQEFNRKPQKGIDHLVSMGIIKSAPKDIARFLHSSHALSKRKLGEYLGEGDEFNKQTLEAYVEEFDFANLSLDLALRQFLSKFWLPGEAQKIDRYMENFAKHFCKQNPTQFTNPDTAYLLAFSVIMLNTDAHNPNIKKENKMTLDQFIANTKGIPNIADVKPGYLEALYKTITVDEIQLNTEGSVFSNVNKKGYMTKQGGRIKTWKNRWFVLNGSLLYYFKTPSDTEPLGIIPLEDVDVRVADMKKKFCFGLYSKGNAGEQMKGAKVNNGGLVVGHHDCYLLCCESKEIMESWIACIGNNIYSTPINDLIQSKKKSKNISPDTHL